MFRGPWLGMYLTPQPSGMSRFSAPMFSNSSALNLVNPHFLETWIFWWPGNLNLVLQTAPVTGSLFCTSVQMDINAWPMWTLATGLSRETRYTCLEPALGTACQPWNVHWEGLSPRGQPLQATGCVHCCGGCYLQPLYTGPLWGKEHRRLNRLQSILPFL